MNQTVRREQVAGLREMVAELTARVKRAESDRADLLAALVELVSEAQDWESALEGARPSLSDAMSQARAAIAKAKGEAT